MFLWDSLYQASDQSQSAAKMTDFAAKFFDHAARMMESLTRGAIPQNAWVRMPKKGPRQKNGSDCGVFVLSAALCLTLHAQGAITGAGYSNLNRPYFAALLTSRGFTKELPWGIPSPAPFPR